ncbi:MAG: DUF7689 domain-containing protein [Planctomycetaceae bacterium]
MHFANFPNATAENLQITSPSGSEYNCIAWALGDNTTWWSSAPGYFWPPRVPKPMTNVKNVVELFRREQFTKCDSPHLEDGFEKIALYSANGRFIHVARQLTDGRWTSKFGTHEDAEHDSLEVLLGGEFEEVVQVMKRARGR